MQPTDPRFVFRIVSPAAPRSALARLASAVLGVAVFVLVLLVGGIFLLIGLGLALALATVFGVRAWWGQRHGPQVAPRDSGSSASQVIEGEFSEITRDDR